MAAGWGRNGRGCDKGGNPHRWIPRVAVQDAKALHRESARGPRTGKRPVPQLHGGRRYVPFLPLFIVCKSLIHFPSCSRWQDGRKDRKDKRLPCPAYTYFDNHNSLLQHTTRTNHQFCLTELGELYLSRSHSTHTHTGCLNCDSLPPLRRCAMNHSVPKLNKGTFGHWRPTNEYVYVEICLPQLTCHRLKGLQDIRIFQPVSPVIDSPPAWYILHIIGITSPIETGQVLFLAVSVT